ncbi:MAG: AAA family ATPase [Neisseriaceae bacterium]|nr:AAA family ATPase [Neisseriaceae bacterium]
MTAWISRIKLTNFKSYENSEFNFPQPQDNGGNLVLIGALNGHGKTTLLEALFLGLYGEKSADILKRAVHYKEENNLLENALSIVAKDKWHKTLNELKAQNKPTYVHKDSQLNVQILIDISYVNECNKKTLTVNRTWGFKFDDKSKDFKLQKQQNKQQNKFFFTLKEESKSIEIEENQFLEIFSEYMPNWNHARFFLFDGEKLADIGDKNHFIRSGLNDLIGIMLLDNTVEGKKGIKQALEERLDKLLKVSKKNKEEQAELNKKQKQLDKVVKDISDKQSQQQQIEEQLSEYAKERDRLTNSLGDNNAKSTQELLKEKQQIEEDKQGLENNIQTALKELPLYLLPNKEINNFNQKIKAEFERIKLENNRKKLAPNLKKNKEKEKHKFLIYGKIRLNCRLKMLGILCITHCQNKRRNMCDTIIYPKSIIKILPQPLQFAKHKVCHKCSCGCKSLNDMAKD